MSSILVALRRLRDDRAPALGLGLLILVTATVFGIAPRLLDRVADDALRGVVAQASAFDRNVSLVEETGLSADPSEPLRQVDEEGDRLDGRMPAAVQGLIGERKVVIDTPRFSIQATTPDPSFIRFRIQPGASTRIHYVAGSAPTATTRTVDLPPDLAHLVPPTDPPSTEPVKVLVLQAAIAAPAAHQIDASAGDVLFLSIDPRDPLSSRVQGLAAIEITGVFEVDDPTDPFWYDDQSIADVSIRSPGGDAKFIDVGALMADDAYDGMVQAIASAGAPLRYAWRHFLATDRLAAAELDPLILDLRRLETTFPQTQVTTNALTGAAMRSGLLPLLVTHQARWASASAILTVVAIGPAIVAFAALGLVAMMAARRRRPALALVRGRGGTVGQIVRAVLLEGCVIAIPAVGLAILLSILLIPTGSNRSTVIAATLVGAIAIGLLIVTAVRGVGAAARGARDDDPPRGISARRLILYGVVVVLAGAGAYLLRERGVKGASSTGSLASADPLIAAVPALAGIAVGLAAIVLVPIPLRFLGRLGARRLGLVPILAFRRAAVGGTTAAVLLVLLATASIGAFSSAALVHLDRASTAAAWHAIGAPFRATAQVGTLPTTVDPLKLPGVTAAAGLFKTLVPVGPRNLRIQLLAVDLAAYESIVRGTPADPAAPPAMLGDLPADKVVPILLSRTVADRTDGAPVGKPFEIVVEGYHYQVRGVDTRATFPTMDPDAVFAIVSRQQLKAVHPDAPLALSSLFLQAPDGDGAELRAAVTAQVPSAVVESRATFATAFTDSPVTAAIVAGIAIAALVAAVYAALAVTAALALSGASRATEVAHLRMVGLSRRDAAGLAILEHGPTVLIAFLVGVALGLGLFALLEPGLGLDALVGARLEVPLSADPLQLALILGGVLAIAAIGIALAAWAQRRGAPVAALRRGME